MNRGTYILGLSSYYHDSAACLVRDGEIVAAAQEERFTRRRGDASFPSQATAFCLRKGGITVSSLSAVAFYDKPLLKFDRIMETWLDAAPAGFVSFLAAGPVWVKEKIHMESAIRRSLGNFEGPVLYGEHHESHAASAFYPSPFENSAILTVDGVGEWATATIGAGAGNDLEIHKELRWPDSLGLLYSAFTHYLGFTVNSDEYKVMGLASYGSPTYVDTILDQLIDLREDGSFTLSRKHFGSLAGLTTIRYGFNDLFGGPPRESGSAFTQRDMDLACSIQAVTEEIVFRMAVTAHRETQYESLCMAGGVALNCVANGKIAREGPFRKLWVQPAAGDAGGAIGAALLAWHRHMRRPRASSVPKDGMKGALLGPGYTQEEIVRWLDGNGAVYSVLEKEVLLSRVAGLLADGKVVGWFNGRMEFGPRALGARSILGDPRRGDIREYINGKVKFREEFRPFAPSVLQERATEYFDLDGDSPFMLLTARVHGAHWKSPSPGHGVLQGFARRFGQYSDIPAVTHVDGTARIHTVEREINPDYYDLIKAFEGLTGCPLLLNTSFNVRGEPIVCTPADAYRCFIESRIDYLVLGPCLLEREKQREWKRQVWNDTADSPAIASSEGRKLGITAGFGFLILGAVLASGGQVLPAVVTAAAGAMLVLLGLLFPESFRPTLPFWKTIERVVSKVSNPVLLGVIYYMIITPVGVVLRLLGHKPLRRREDASSFWFQHGQRGSMERQF